MNNQVNNEEYKHSSIGEFREIITYPDGTTETTPWRRNTIVNDIGKLVACLFKNHAGYSGLGYWVIGSGDDIWTGEKTATPPKVTDTGVIKEIGRKKIETKNISFIDEDDRPTETITNKIMIDVTFSKSECNGEWREFSIVGGNATERQGTGIAINHKTHGLIDKVDGMEIRRQIKFTFR